MKKINIKFLEEAKYKDLDSKRAYIDYHLARAINELADYIEEIDRQLAKLKV